MKYKKLYTFWQIILTFILLPSLWLLNLVVLRWLLWNLMHLAKFNLINRLWLVPLLSILGFLLLYLMAWMFNYERISMVLEPDNLVYVLLSVRVRYVLYIIWLTFLFLISLVFLLFVKLSGLALVFYISWNIFIIYVYPIAFRADNYHDIDNNKNK